jgi:hypothetical protein
MLPSEGRVCACNGKKVLVRRRGVPTQLVLSNWAARPRVSGEIK